MTVSEDFTGLAGGVPGALLAHSPPLPGSRAGPGGGLVGVRRALRAGERAGRIWRAVREGRAGQVADLLGRTTPAVNSGLRRARAQLARGRPAEDELAEPAGPEARAVLDRFAAAFENADASALAELLREDVALEMPPLLTWFAGRQAVARFFAAAPVFDVPGRLRLVPVVANGQPAFAAYLPEPGGP